tara:strand:- start:119 stop:397 length:279 start_codon:yes stop_codon:yes gene_type:complete
MLRCITIVGIVCTFLSGCAYNPVIDTSGRSGTFDKSNADQITNDIQHCRMLVAEHSNFVEDIVYWVFSPESETKSTKMNKLCLKNRGHSVIR